MPTHRADSLMKQAFDMLSIMMTVPDMHGHFDLFVESRTMRDGYPQEFWTTVTLNPHSPHYPRYRAALPHVPEERLKRPFLSFARNELLLPWPELQGMLSEYGHRKWDPMAGWYLYNATYEEFLPSDPTPRWKGERNSVVLLNSGAHWTANRFNLTDQRIADAMYIDMVGLRSSHSADCAGRARLPTARRPTQAGHHLPLDDRRSLQLLGGRSAGPLCPADRHRAQST